MLAEQDRMAHFLGKWSAFVELNVGCLNKRAISVVKYGVFRRENRVFFSLNIRWNQYLLRRGKTLNFLILLAFAKFIFGSKSLIHFRAA
jgi:hypothetical protein